MWRRNCAKYNQKEECVSNMVRSKKKKMCNIEGHTYVQLCSDKTVIAWYLLFITYLSSNDEL